MQSVSQAYKDSMNSLVRNKNTITINMQIENLEFNKDVVITSENQLNYSNIDHIRDDTYNIPFNYATCELNFMGLNKNRKIIDYNDLKYQGLVISSISDGNCDYLEGNRPTIVATADTTKEYNLYGLNITFDNNDFGSIPKELIVNGYNDEALVSTQTIENNTNETVMLNSFSGIDKIEIIILKTNLPYRRTRVKNIYFGVKRTYVDNEIVETVESKKINPLSNEMAEKKFEFIVDNMNYDYNMENPTSIYQFFMSNQKVKYSYGYELDDGTIENIKGGIVYLDGMPKADGIDATFTAYGLYYFMTNEFFDSNNYEEGISFGAILDNIFNDFPMAKNEIGENMWRIDSSLYEKYFYGVIPVMASNVLIQLICNATGMIVDEDRDGYINIIPNRSNVEDFKITLNDDYEFPEIEYLEQVKDITVKIYNYEIAETTSKLYSGSFRNVTTETKIKCNYKDEGQFVNISSTITNGTIISEEYHSTYCEITYIGEASKTTKISVIGYAVEENSRDYVISVNESGEDCPVDNKFVTTDEMAVELAERTEEYLQKRKKYSIEYMGNPELETNDIINIENQFIDNTTMRILNHQIEYNGGIKGVVEGKEN